MTCANGVKRRGHSSYRYLKYSKFQNTCAHTIRFSKDTYSSTQIQCSTSEERSCEQLPIRQIGGATDGGDNTGMVLTFSTTCHTSTYAYRYLQPPRLALSGSRATSNSNKRATPSIISVVGPVFQESLFSILVVVTGRAED